MSNAIQMQMFDQIKEHKTLYTTQSDYSFNNSIFVKADSHHHRGPICFLFNIQQAFESEL